MKKRKSKRIELSLEAIERITIIAVKKKTTFKVLVENHLENVKTKL